MAPAEDFARGAAGMVVTARMSATLEVARMASALGQAPPKEITEGFLHVL